MFHFSLAHILVAIFGHEHVRPLGERDLQWRMYLLVLKTLVTILDILPGELQEF